MAARAGTMKATGFAILAAAFYAVCSPFSKMLLEDASPTMMSAFLYLGAGIGLTLFMAFRRAVTHHPVENPLRREDLRYTVAMVVLDIIAPILLMSGLAVTSAATTSLLNNFEIVATTIIALVIFKERVSPMLWAAIMFVTVSSILLSVDDLEGFVLSPGALLILGACVCWGLENNCTRAISERDPIQITSVKGLCSGTGALIVALAIGSPLPSLELIGIILALGFVSYGLSISSYIRAQRDLGAARVSAYYSLAPFIGVAISFALFDEALTASFALALLFMLIGTVLTSIDAMGSESAEEAAEAGS